jgi:3D (Asp-Asp-Asp) domain-containing protein/peptidoglycan hydrolase CwlO-like protein
MIKKFIAFLISVAFLVSSGSIVSADNNPQEAIANSKIKLQQMSDKILETNKQISALNIQLDKLNNEINKNNTDISKNIKLIEAEKANMEKLMKEVKASQQLANKRLRIMYINGYNENLISVLLSSKSFSDFLSRLDSVKRIANFDKKLINELVLKKKNLNEAITNLDLKSQELQQLKNTNSEKLKQVSENKKTLQDLVKKFEQEKSSAAQLIKENEEKLIAHAISIVDSSSSNISSMKGALQTLNSLYPQLSTDSVKKKAKAYIDSGNKKLADLIAKSSQPVDTNGDTYKATFSMSATAYSGGGLTALGLKPVRDPANLSTIAVDPSIIPLGTKVYIPGYGYAICSDTGGSVKGNKIDLYMNSIEECFRWGRRTVTLHVIAYPGEW